MILFLDTISPLPEFSIIEDNKIIFSKKIINSDNSKLSDSLIPVYIKLNQQFNLRENLNFLVTLTGPGSYTALRLGIAFFSGLSYSMKVPFIGLSCLDLIKLTLNLKEFETTAIYIHSSNNQKYICIYEKKYKKYKIMKLENNDDVFDYNKDLINKIMANDENLYLDSKLPKDTKYEIFSFKDIVFKNKKKITLLPRSNIIEPIYISNNLILNK